MACAIAAATVAVAANSSASGNEKERERASHGDYSESRWQLQGNVLSQSHLLCDLPRDIELAAAAAGGAVASIWPHSLLQLRRVDKSATATT